MKEDAAQFYRTVKEVIEAALRGFGLSRNIKHLGLMAAMIPDELEAEGLFEETAKKLCRALMRIDPTPDFQEVMKFVRNLRVLSGREFITRTWLNKYGASNEEEVLAWAQLLYNEQDEISAETRKTLEQAAKNVGVALGDDLKEFVEIRICQCPEHQIKRMDIDGERKAALLRELEEFSWGGFRPELSPGMPPLETQLINFGISEELASILAVDIRKKIAAMEEGAAIVMGISRANSTKSFSAPPSNTIH